MHGLHITENSEQKLEVMKVAGVTALFSEERIKTVPKGAHLAHFRYCGEEYPMFASLEPCVWVDHIASIITLEPLDFGESRCIEFNSENDEGYPCYVQERLTFSEFKKKYK